jgi:hypothetical protein
MSTIIDPRTGHSDQTMRLALMMLAWLRTESICRALVSTRKASPGQILIVIARLKATLTPSPDSAGLPMNEWEIATLLDVCLENSAVRKAIARDVLKRSNGPGRKGVLAGLRDLRANVRREYGLDAEAQGVVVA